MGSGALGESGTTYRGVARPLSYEPEPIELDHGHRVYLTPPRCVQQGRQTLPLVTTAGLTVVEELVSLPAPRFCVLTKSVDLGIERLFAGGDSGVEGDTEG